MYPELLKNGYSERFSIGLIAAGSETALLIPPSITVIIYGWLTGASITKLFAASLIIGLVLGGLFIGYVVIQSIRHDVGRLERQGLAVRLKALQEAYWALGMPVIILGGLYSGLLKATKAPALRVAYALIFDGLVYRELPHHH